MEASETLQQYYELSGKELPAELKRSNGLVSHFNVFCRKNCMRTMPFRRRDYYKIYLSRGKAIIFTEKGEVSISQPAVFFADPVTKFGWRNVSDEQEGYICVFNELYIPTDLKRELKLLYRLYDDAVYPFSSLTDEQYQQFFSYFQQMEREYRDDFAYKEKMIQQILRLIIYTAIKIRLTKCPGLREEKPELLVTRFQDLLDAQFPIDSPQSPILLRSPADFADQLHVHVNHLNHSIKQGTGKTTSQLIQEKKLTEAIDLLKNTDWNVAEISSSLGFEYPQYFNLFFKKLTGQSPRAYRMEEAVHV